MERDSRSAGRDFIRHIPVRILIEGKDQRTLPGLSASADVKVSMEQRGVLVPREALRYEAGQQAGGSVRAVEGGDHRKPRVAVHGLRCRRNHRPSSFNGRTVSLRLLSHRRI